MSTSPDQEKLRRISECGVCGGSKLEVVFELTQLPLTALYCPQPPKESPGRYDQELLICNECGHAQARHQLDSSVLYDQEYGFRTSASATARKGTDFFLRVLERFRESREFATALDLGCNDLYLLGCLKGHVQVRLGIDPIWKDQEDRVEDPGIRVVGDVIENLDFDSQLEDRPDLVLCRHSLEHVASPKAVLGQLARYSADNALFLFEVPGFDALVRRRRFDQVFHQHLHYFSLRSFQRLIAETGMEYLGFAENYHDWGALLVAFRKSDRRGSRVTPVPELFGLPEIRERYIQFKRHLLDLNQILESFSDEGKVYGYGAAQMLPVLAYHMETDFSSLAAVLDDDPAKNGWYYQNLRPPIRHTGSVGPMEEATVFVTAVDNVKPILRKLLGQRPKHILLPFNLF